MCSIPQSTYDFSRIDKPTDSLDSIRATTKYWMRSMFHYRSIAVTILSSVQNDIKSLFAAARKMFVIFVVRMLSVIAHNNLCISDRPLMPSTFYFRRRERNPDRAAVQHIFCRMHFSVCSLSLCSNHRQRIAVENTEWTKWTAENNNATFRKLRDAVFDLIAVGHKVDNLIYHKSYFEKLRYHPQSSIWRIHRRKYQFLIFRRNTKKCHRIWCHSNHDDYYYRLRRITWQLFSLVLIIY